MQARPALQRLLAPRHIAFVGGDASAEAIRQCRGLGFDGQIWPVHPHRETIEGLPCFPDVAALPEAPDAAVVAVPPEASVSVVETLAARGVGGAVCYAAGFAETGPDGADLQSRLVEVAGNMAVIGPNCIGVLNYLDGAALWPDQHGGQRIDRGVAVITQSGNIGQNLTMQQRSLPLAQLVTVGNRAVTDVPDVVEALLADPRVTAIGLHLESVSDAPALSRAALAALRQRIPLVVLKSGSSELGARTNLSHTGSLAGADDLWDALFSRCGMARVRDIATLVEALKLLHVHGPLSGVRLASASCSGGEAALIADLAESHGVIMPALPDAPAARLREVLGEAVTVANPLDYHTYVWGDYASQASCFTELLGSGFDLHALVLDFPAGTAHDPALWWSTLDAFVEAHQNTGAPACVISSLPEGMPEAARIRLLHEGIAPMQGTADCLTAIAAAYEIGVAQATAHEVTPLDPVREVDGTEPYLVAEHIGKRCLAGHGVAVPDGTVTDAQDAPSVARRLGFPVVVKALSPQIAHKSEIGGVHLGLTDEQQVAAAVEKMSRLSARFLVEQMVHGAVAELIVGVRRDSQFGLALTLGAGGMFVEVLRDATTLLLPTTPDAITAALRSLRTWPLLVGARGGEVADVDSVVHAATAIADFARSHDDTLVELDVNPLLVLPAGHGVVAVDVLVRHDHPNVVATEQSCPVPTGQGVHL